MEAVYLSICPDFPSLTGRKKEDRKITRRAMILSIATDHFLNYGYSGTTMSSISESLGGSKSTLWNYFSDKADLFGSVLGDLLDEHHVQLAVALNPVREIESAIENFAVSFIEIVTSARAVAFNRLVVAETVRFPELGDMFDRKIRSPLHDLVTKFLSGAMERGLLMKGNPASAAGLLIALCMSESHQKLMFGQKIHMSKKIIEEEVSRILSIFFKIFPKEHH